MPRFACIAGARPNFMKIKPVLDALEARGAGTVLVHTGQHYDAGMSDVFFDELGIRPPDVSLGVGSGTHAEQTGRVMTAFEELLPSLEADAVVVVGDVNSTLACTLVAAKASPPIPVAHVEAGLRSRDWTMPEEVNRVVTDRLARWLLAPSPDGVDNLLAEGADPTHVHLVGNVMVDTLLANRHRAEGRAIRRDLGVAGRDYALLTLHRPATVDDPTMLDGVIGAIADVGERLPVVFPVHPRTRARLAERGDLPASIVLTEPLGYLDFLALQAAARVVLTDSGGIQEETTVLGVPCLTLRDNTERPITLTEGTNRLVGRDPDQIRAAVDDVLDHPPPARRPALWDGHAAERIADALLA
jgi:UDP-N-acetylglucosamine 2-epimerase (non-hydrolysing)